MKITIFDKRCLVDEYGEPVINTQNGFIKIFNNLGKRMISSGDIYWIAEHGDESLIKTIQDDCVKNFIATSTRNYYRKYPKGIVIHNFGSNIAKPIKSNVVIPYFNYESLDTVVKDKDGLKYMQALSDTDDGAEKIMDNYERLSGKPSSRTKISTPDQDSRKTNPERAVFFDFYGGDFRVYGDSHVDNNDGRSRGGSLIAEGEKKILMPELEDVLEITNKYIAKINQENLKKELSELYKK